MVALRNNLTRLTLLKILQAYGAAAIYGRALAAAAAAAASVLCGRWELFQCQTKPCLE